MAIKRSAVLVLSAGVWLGAAPAFAAATPPAPPPAAQPTWPAVTYNPQPQAGDLLLPTPCGGAMAFRRVDTLIPDANWLADQRFRMGSPDTRQSWAEDLRFGYIAGDFSDGDDPRRRHYFIGKYEVTRAQYAALSGKDCAATQELARQPDGALPEETLGWFDAVEFTRRYSDWLRREVPAALPQESGGPGFVRLPTEAEWEYAARGGGAVMPAQQAQSMFPMAGDPGDYVWLDSACNGQTQPVGLLKANPLGLHDILGNVGEIALEPFRATAPGRLHGQTGGFVVRGGSCLTSELLVRTAARQEEPFFDAAGERRPPMTGMRLALGAPVGGNQSRIEAFAKATQQAGETVAAAPAPRGGGPDAMPNAAPNGDMAARARALAQQADRPALMDDINRLAADIAAAEYRKAELVSRAARSAVMSGAVLMRNYRQEMDEATRLKEILNAMSAERKPAVLTQIDRWSNRARLSGEAYLSLLIEAADNFGPDSLRAQLPQVEAAFSYDGGAAITKMARRFVEQCARHHARPPADLREFLQESLQPL